MRLVLPVALIALAAAISGSVPRAIGAADPVEVELAGYIHEFDAGFAIGGETDPAGWVVSPRRVNQPVALPRIAYLDAKDAGLDLADFDGRYCLIRGLLERGALEAGGVETPHRTFDLLRILDIRSTAAPLKAVRRLPGRILADLEALGVDFGASGTSQPTSGLSSDGTIDGRRLALVLPLVVPPEGSADMFTDTAYVDRPSRRYWAVRTGGFAGVTQWVGPFRLPRPRR